jgi:quinol monooxygenase YgiN
LYWQEKNQDNMRNDKIHIQVEIVIAKNKTEEYKKLIRNMSRLVKDNEPDTLEYKFYLSKDGTKCIVHETYMNSKAALAHNNGIASKTILPKIFNISKISRLDVYGNPNKDLQIVLTNFGAQTHSLFTGFSR